MEITELKVSAREESGKGSARRMRKKGMVPGIFYGRDIETIMIKVDTHEMEVALSGHEGTPIFHVVPQGKDLSDLKGTTVMVRDIQRDPLSLHYLHIDLLKVDMDVEITVDVPIQFVGDSIGVTMGGVLQEVRRKLEILALPGNIPDAIVVDITELDIGDSIHIQDIQLPSGCSTGTDINFTVATVGAPRVVVEEEELLDLDVEGEEAPEEGEGEGEGKGERE